MQSAVLRALEFDRIVEMVRGFALTPMGDERLARLAPSSDPQQVARWLAATTETAKYLGREQPVSAARVGRAAPDARRAGRRRTRARTATAARAGGVSRFGGRGEGRHPAGAGIVPASRGGDRRRGVVQRETAQVRDKIDPSGDVVDDASPELKHVRERLRKQRSRLRGTLESYLRGKDTAKYLQDQVVTERNGRYVLVVKAEHRTSIPGIVHGASTSGASLFLEPLSTVEINNDIVALEEQEAEEIHRILLALTDAFRARAADLARTIDAATELDVLQARARFSESVDGIEPALSDGAFELQAARHPLVKGAVPVTIKIIPPASCLLITGPNTGGKTVALKTAGLLALMAQSGLQIPAADGSRLPVFRSSSPTSATNSRSTPA